jgi:SAM-dependent methyltransferase
MNDEWAREHPEILAYYDEGKEQERLANGTSRLEAARTQLILQRYLPQAPARILDVGGGPGAYARWLTDQGFTVHLVDLIPRHVEEASAQSNGYTVALGDARDLAEADRSVDAVLLLGPLYHLPERADRLRALGEARRVLRPGGRLIAATISRFASLLDGVLEDRLADPDFAQVVEQDLKGGRHDNPENRPGWFTTAYFQHPDQLAEEVREAGFELEGILAVEGPFWILPDFEARWQDEKRRQQILDALVLIERESSMLGASAHVLAVAHCP